MKTKIKNFINFLFKCNVVRVRKKWLNSEKKKKRNFLDVSINNNINLDLWDKIKFDKWWLFYYNKINENSVFDSRFIPEDIYYCYIDLFFNDCRKAKYLDDKNFYDFYFHDINKPETLYRKINGVFLDVKYNVVDLECVLGFCKSQGGIILKPAIESEGGRGILVYRLGDDDRALISFLQTKDNFIIQKLVVQHPQMALLHSNSLNTIRIITFFFEGEIRVLSAICRMGINGANVDNASAGGIFCGINLQNGRLKDVAFNTKGEKYLKHPQGAVFGNFTIPNFDKCKKLVVDLAPRIFTVSKLASWDLAIDENGNPVLIEVNMSFGEIDFHQMTNGPIFGDLTPKVLNVVFEDKFNKFVNKFLF